MMKSWELLFLRPVILIFVVNGCSGFQATGRDAPPQRRWSVKPTASADEWGIVRQPTADVAPAELVPMLMKAMHLNDFPDQDSGLTTVYDWSSDMCRRACGRSSAEFVEMSYNSVFGMCVGGNGDYELTEPQMVGDNMFSVKVEMPSPDSRPSRLFLWQLRKEMRPPASGAWLIHGVIASDVEGGIYEGD